MLDKCIEVSRGWFQLIPINISPTAIFLYFATSIQYKNQDVNNSYWSSYILITDDPLTFFHVDHFGSSETSSYFISDSLP